MSCKLQIVFILASVMTFIFVIFKIRKQGMNIDDAIGWIVWSILLLIVSFIPGIPTFISATLGFMSPSNFIFCLFILFLYLRMFSMSSEISRMKENNKELIQKLSMKEYEDEKNGK